MPNPRKKLGTALEKKIVADAKAQGLRASKQPLSGVLADFPNDAVVEDLLVEAKVRAVKIDAKGTRMLTIDLDWLDGVQKNAAKAGFAGGVVFIRPKNSARLLVLVEDVYFWGLLRRANGRG